MTTFGEFFKQLRRRAESTGKTDSACGAMDTYRRKRHSGPDGLYGDNEGWTKVCDQELSPTNFLEFSQEMSQFSTKMLLETANSDCFSPDHFGWYLRSASEFHHATMEVARKYGLNVDSIRVGTESS